MVGLVTNHSFACSSLRPLEYIFMKFFLTVVITCITNILPGTTLACECGCADGAIGIFWGHFDPPNETHLDIIKKSLYSYEIKKIVIVINDFKGKTDKIANTSALDREKIFKQTIPADLLQNIVIFTQNENNIWDYRSIKQRFSNYRRHYVIVGADSYTKFLQNSSKKSVEKNYDVILLFPGKQQIAKDMLAKNVLLQH
jgi:nicotinic acid mononucleotide adenylyltransferase